MTKPPGEVPRLVGKRLGLLFALSLTLASCDGGESLTPAPKLAPQFEQVLPVEFEPPPTPPGVVLSVDAADAWRVLALADQRAPLAPELTPAPGNRIPAVGGPRLRAKAWYVVDEDTGEVLTARRAEEPRPIASISKLASMLLYFDAGLPGNELLTITREVKAHMQVTRSKLRVRGQYRAEDLAYMALLTSDNRASAALAFSTGLPNDAFAAAMTRRARRMGLDSASFADPTGLHPENVASPRDAARLLAVALDHPQVGSILRTIEHDYERQDRWWPLKARNSNLLKHYDHWEVDGGKTGYTVVAGACLVIRTEIAGRNLLVALLGARWPDDRWDEMVRLRYWIEDHVPPRTLDRVAKPAESAGAQPG